MVIGTASEFIYTAYYQENIAHTLDALIRRPVSENHRDVAANSVVMNECNAAHQHSALPICNAKLMVTQLLANSNLLYSRIQQIQLLGRNIKPPNFEKMWHQLEAEIHLHRHKTVIKACRGANKLPQPKEVQVHYI